ncbi:MAG: transposase, partial [Fibrobacterota bacterium]
MKLHSNEEKEVKEISPQAIINDYHMRARDELVNRALKDFGTEHLPFKRFTSNAAYYYLMAIAFFIFEAFKKDAGSSAVEITWYAQTFRRKFLDFAGQVVRSGRRIKMKINAALIERLD